MQQMIHIATQLETLTKKFLSCPRKKTDTYCYSIREPDSKKLMFGTNQESEKLLL